MGFSKYGTTAGKRTAALDVLVDVPNQQSNQCSQCETRQWKKGNVSFHGYCSSSFPLWKTYHICMTIKDRNTVLGGNFLLQFNLTW